MSITNTPIPTVPVQDGDKQFFGHPRGLATLYFTEMWERFSYYGMRALLILFMTATVQNGGLGFDVGRAGAIYGLYTAMAYMVTLPGGWIADRILGQRKSVLYGGIIIASGHFCMAFPGLPTFYLGLGLIVIGTGLLKPNVSTMVGELYSKDDNRRDAGFSIFYMGINLGAFLSPIFCGYVGEKVNWHWGFGLAGFGMTLGVIQYLWGAKYLGTAGLYPVPATDPGDAQRQRSYLIWGCIACGIVIAAIFAVHALGIVQVTADGVADFVGYFLAVVVVVLFGWLLFGGDWTPIERKRMGVIGILFLAAALFWSAFEQAGSTLNLFAERSTDRNLFGYEYPASWFQSLNSLYIITLAPVMGWLWLRLGKREPSSAGKFAWGLIFVGLGFLVMVIGATRAAGGVQVSSFWLWATYLLHTIGELCLSPVGLSAMTKLAPARVAGLIMGIWFLASSVGNYIGGRVASVYETFSPASLFVGVTAFCIVLGLVLAAFAKSIRELSGGVK
jgi:POT family proton-dependent oligopeptide transporter